jgi:hypothetical protein
MPGTVEPIADDLLPKSDHVPAGAGARTDPDYERRLAEEAEAGFDPASLSRRQAGRPSLSGRAGHSKRVDLRVDDETYEAIRRIIDRSNRRVSDVVRDATNQYLEAS